MYHYEKTGNVLIDGELHKSNEVNPKIHHYLGMFRCPIDQIKKYSNNAQGCPEVYYMDLSQQVQERYARGIHDIPQYVTIK